MKLLRLPLILFAVLFTLVAIAFVARATGLWPAGETTHARPQQHVP